MFSVTNFCFQGRLSENSCDDSESEYLSHSKWNRYWKVLQVRCVYSGYYCVLNVEVASLTSFVMFCCSNRKRYDCFQVCGIRIRPVGNQRTVVLPGGSADRHQVPAGPFLAIPQSRILLVMPSGEPIHTGTWFFQTLGRLLCCGYFLSLRMWHVDNEALLL